jgi:type IV secretion system protein VirB6
MTACLTFGSEGPAGIADALQKIDCMAAAATNVAFGRLFGPGGQLLGALTIILTFYVALLAYNLLTGRSALRLSVLTPRMMTLGLVLTFATSWIAYQSVVWTLATGAADQIAGILLGTKGSATLLFAQRLDAFFYAISEAATVAGQNASMMPTFTSAANILSIAALLLLLGTVGVLVVCRLALAALLILGPIFIVLALFEGTRGLFEGWLKSVVMVALVPLLTVVMGSGALLAIAPMVNGLAQAGSDIPLRMAVSILVAAVVYLSLMLMVFKIAANITKGWRLGRASAAESNRLPTASPHHSVPLMTDAAAPAVYNHAVSSRVGSAVSSIHTNSYRESRAVQLALPSTTPGSAASPLGVAATPNSPVQLRRLPGPGPTAPTNTLQSVIR